MLHYNAPPLWKWLGVLFAPALLWLGLNHLAVAADEAPLQLLVEASASEIVASGTAVYTVTLSNTSEISRTAALSATLSGPTDGALIDLVADATQDVQTQRSNRTSRRFQWGGEIGPGGGLTLRITTRAGMFADEDAGDAIQLRAAAGPNPNNLILQAQATVAVNQLPPVDPGTLAFAMVLTDAQGNPLPVTPGVDGEPDQIPVSPGTPFYARLSLTNTTGSALAALVTGNFTTTGENDEAVCGVRVTGTRMDAGVGQTISSPILDDRHLSYAFLFTLSPTTTVQGIVQMEMFGSWDCSVTHQSALRIHPVAGDPDRPILPRPAILRRLLELPPRLTPPLLLTVVLSDLGDAPDSTNHFGVNMTAYPGVTANFPTVFDPATGLPPGPRHRFVRPLFLGNMVSVEAEADLTVLALNRNLDPPNDIANLDLHDDGVNVGAMNLQHCVTTVIPFRVTISQAAVDRLKEEGKTAYLNVWLDGNRDGDWDDVLSCDGIQATEHIVIDQMVNPPAGGVYSLIAPTRNLPIPPNQVGREMWLRATLSDEPSVKTGQVTSLGQVIEYGDGRGPANGFRLGETEDYLVKPRGYVAQRGPDLTVEGDVVAWEDVAATDDSVVQVGEFIQRLRVRNLGDAAAGGTLIIRTQPYLGIPTTSIAEVETAIPAALPFQEVCDGPSNCHIELALAELQPGALSSSNGVPAICRPRRPSVF